MECGFCKACNWEKSFDIFSIVQSFVEEGKCQVKYLKRCGGKTFSLKEGDFASILLVLYFSVNSSGQYIIDTSYTLDIRTSFTLDILWSDGLVVKLLDSQSWGLVFKTAGWLQGQLSLSSFRGHFQRHFWKTFSLKEGDFASILLVLCFSVNSSGQHIIDTFFTLDMRRHN